MIKTIKHVYALFLLTAFVQVNVNKASPIVSSKGNYFQSLPEKSDFEKGMLNKIDKTPVKPETSFSAAKDFFFNIFDILKIKNLLKTIGDNMETDAQCFLCKFVFAFLEHYINKGASEDDLGSLGNRVCTMFLIQDPIVCSGLSKINKGALKKILDDVALNPDEICGIIISGCGDIRNPLNTWTVPLTHFPKPLVRPPRPPKPGSPVLRVLHISDTHVDPFYKEGTNANCGLPLCCRETSGNLSNPADAAGLWGDYRKCDTPMRTFENMLDHINKAHKIDYVIWTGDIPPHDIWNNTREEAVYLLHAATKTIKKHLGNVPVFPALGNHEASPVNSFPIPQLTGNESISWLYNEVEKAWSPWLPESSSTLKLGAYYSVLAKPGLRIISLNMNYCNNLNWWLLLNTTDPTGELAWLVSELQKAEHKKEKVHIIGHIPPGEPDCIAVWSSNYYRIINRYESTVTAQFFGHTHRDEFEVFYDKSGAKPRATSIAYVGPSVTTSEGTNPSYRIYTVDGNYNESSWVVLDHESYYMNLTEANLDRIPKWRLEYSAKKAFNMPSLLPSDWDSLTHRFEKDDELFQRYYRFYTVLSDYNTAPCNDKCKKTLLCKLRRGQSNEPAVC